jgi:hypothetical protein
MGSQGRDVQLSEQALRVFRYGVECKSRAQYAVYRDFSQAVQNANGDVPLLVIKQNRAEPLAIVTLDHFMELVRESKKNSTD